MRPLTPDMLDYAAQDTLPARIERSHVGRAQAWAAWSGREEFALLEGTLGGRAWHVVPQTWARATSIVVSLLLRELVPWRDSVAKQLDRATFRVLGNEQLLDIARSQPGTRDALGKIKACRWHSNSAEVGGCGAARWQCRIRLAEVPRAAMGPRSEFDSRCQR